MRSFLRLIACAPILLLTGSIGHATERDVSLFVEPPGLEPDVQFWVRIYTRVGQESGLLHDSRNLAVVYEELDLPENRSVAATEIYVDKRKDKYRRILKELGSGKREGLDPEEQRILDLFAPDVSNKTLRAHGKRIRFQLGQADQFRAGLIRSGAYADHILKTLSEMDLPPQLAALPHVESSFTPGAYSRVGAAGLWQFTRATGRRYMRVDQVVDERLDPYRATTGAGRLLAQNRRTTGSWPLAVTAYNHGASGMRRATRKLGHSDIERIVRDYRSRRFGFASRNFYVEFLAASRIAENPERYFGELVLDSPIQYESLPLPYYASAQALSRALNVDLATLRASNPALLAPVWNGQKRVPLGFEFKVPVAELSQSLARSFASLPVSERFSQQTRDSTHTVRRGETLSRIAQKYQVSIRELESLNNLRNRNKIRVGQRLRLPVEHASEAKRTGKQTTTPTSPPTTGIYTVRKGETLASIALRFGLDEEEIAWANGIQNRNRIYAGQQLKFPGPSDDPSARSISDKLSPDSQPREAEPPENEPNDTELEVVSLKVESMPGPTPLNLLADPSDYLVGPENTIEVQFGETLGHYAEWLDIRAQQLRVLNRLRFGEALPIHSRLRLDFGRVTRSLFEKQRIDFQRSFQERYFSEREIVGSFTHKLKRGDSIWDLAHQRFKIPLWLLQQYNPDIDFETASAGTEIIVPILERRTASETD
jgi:membrane-bound lytic murein transglycosylase D